ncbi:MAG: OsmC family protein [Bdellovibrionota bacterium]
MQLPIEFKSKATASGEFVQPWLIECGEYSAKCAVPSEFGGVGDGFSPEDLFLQALMNCFIGTFKVYAKSSKIHFSKLELNGNLVVDQNSSREVRMHKCDLTVQIWGAERPDRAKTLADKVFRDGFILNSVKTEISYKLIIEGIL